MSELSASYIHRDEWFNHFKFKYIFRGEYAPNNIKYESDKYDRPKSSNSSTYKWDMAELANILFNDALPSLLKEIDDKCWAIDLDFISFDSAGKHEIDENNFIQTDSGGNYFSECFYVTARDAYNLYYNDYKYVNGNYYIDSSINGQQVEFNVYLTLKVKENFIIDSRPAFTWKFYDSIEDYDKKFLSSVITNKADYWGNPIAPDVPQLRRADKDNKNLFKIYTAGNWEKVKDADTGLYYFKAKYTETNYVSIYTVGENNVDIFTDAETYHYGKKSPIGNYFLPLGDDNSQNTVDDVLIQYPEANAYSKVVSVDGFTIGQQQDKINYIERGTFPLCGENSLSWESISSTGNQVTVKVTYNRDTTISNIEVGGNSPFNSKINEIKRLGFILVGGGGGCGGYAEYDNCSSGSEEEYVCPGSGGGGGETVVGVLNVECPQVNRGSSGFVVLDKQIKLSNSIKEIWVTSIEFIVKIGQGGNPGASDYNDGGSHGTSGGDSTIDLQINYTYTTPGGAEYSSFVKKETLVRAAGGEGGKRGTIDYAEIDGGKGGSSIQSSNFKNNWCCICYSYSGISGGKIHLDSSDNYKNSYADDVLARDLKLHFSIEEANEISCKNIQYNSVAAAVSVKDVEKGDLKNSYLPGGHSYGHGGGYVGARGERLAPGFGGGGCMTLANSELKVGGKGFFGVYY